MGLYLGKVAGSQHPVRRILLIAIPDIESGRDFRGRPRLVFSADIDSTKTALRQGNRGYQLYLRDNERSCSCGAIARAMQM